MATTARAIMAPRGALTPELLLALRSTVAGATAAEDVAAAYAREGTVKVSEWADEDRAARGAAAWAQYAALMARAQQILSTAASLSADDVSRSYSSSQAVELQKRAAQYLVVYETEAAAEVPGAAAPRPSSSRSVRTTVVW